MSCPVCGRTFGSKGSLGVHRQVNRRGRHENPCRWTDEELAAKAAERRERDRTKLAEKRAREGRRPDVLTEAQKARRIARQRRRRRRAQYARTWRAAHPDYHAQWRAQHADEERERRRQRDRGDRSAEYRRRRLISSDPVPEPFLGHPLFAQARQLVVPTRTWGDLQDPLNEDLMSVAVLAILEGEDPVAAVRAARAAEVRWRRSTGPIIGDFAA